jgi:hypothetical protein
VSSGLPTADTKEWIDFSGYQVYLKLLQVKVAYLFVDICGDNVSGGWSVSVGQVPEIRRFLTVESRE